MNYELPKAVTVNGVEYPIRSDYRAILDIITALNDPELDDRDKAFVMLDIFFEDFEQMSPDDYEAGLKACCEFIDHGATGKDKSPKLMDWEQDFEFILAPINRISGHDIRNDEYLHWWSFLSLYYEIGDCLFAQIVRVRKDLKKGRLKDKIDREWYNENRDIVDFHTRYTDAEEELLKLWGGNV